VQLFCFEGQNNNAMLYLIHCEIPISAVTSNTGCMFEIDITAPSE